MNIENLHLKVKSLSKEQKHEFACRCAEQILHTLCDPGVAQRALNAKRAWVQGSGERELIAARFSLPDPSYACSLDYLAIESATWQGSWAAAWITARNVLAVVDAGISVESLCELAETIKKEF